MSIFVRFIRRMHKIPIGLAQIGPIFSLNCVSLTKFKEAYDVYSTKNDSIFSDDDLAY